MNKHIFIYLHGSVLSSLVPSGFNNKEQRCILPLFEEAVIRMFYILFEFSNDFSKSIRDCQSQTIH